MKTIITSMFVALALLSGCSSVKMQPTELVTAAKANKALVNFVRPSILVGDGLGVNLWDGETFIGSLGAGKLIQYEVEPGKHLFLASQENWSYASADLEAGKQYIIKVNIFPGVLTGRVALGTLKVGDPRTTKLMSLKPTTASENDRTALGDKKREQVKKAIANFDDGQVTSFAKVTPEDGR